MAALVAVLVLAAGAAASSRSSVDPCVDYGYGYETPAADCTERPHATFDVDPAAPRAGGEIELDSSSSRGTHEWDLDDDGEFDDATGERPTTHFATAGTYPVTLRVTDAHGRSATARRDVYVHSTNAKPQIFLDGYPSNPIAGSSNTYGSYWTDEDDNTVDVAWDFDGDGTFETPGENVHHTFTDAGRRTVAVRATDAGGAIAYARRSINISQPANRDPSVYLSLSPSRPRAGQPVTFDSEQWDTDSNSLTLAWELDGDGDFDDPPGTTVPGRATRTYATATDLEVGVRATDGQGGQVEQTMTLTIAGDNMLPSASLSPYPRAPLAGDVVEFYGYGYDWDQPVGGAVSYAWDLDGDLAFDDSTSQWPVKTYATPGTVSIGLRVTDAEGGSTIVREDLAIGSKPPQADFEFTPRLMVSGQPVHFTATATDPDGTIAGYDWDLDADGTFGDATGSTAQHTYAEDGDYQVGLRVRDDAGDVTVVRHTVGGARPPRAVLAASRTRPRAGTDVVLDATGSYDPDGGALTYAYDLDGDGTFERAGDAKLTWRPPVAGKFAVGVRVTDDEGATATNVVTVTVHAENIPPTVSINGSGTVIAGVPVEYEAFASDQDDDIGGYAWDLDGDGDYDDGTHASATATFAATGYRRVSVRVSDAADPPAVATATRSVYVSGGVSAPYNDDFVDAAEVTTPTTGGYGYSLTTSAATAQLGEPAHAGAAAAHSVWYRWRATANARIVVTTCSSFQLAPDTTIGVYSGDSFSALTEVAKSDDDATCVSSPKASTVRFTATAGQVYRIAVDTPRQMSGYFTVTFRLAPVQDQFADALELTSPSGSTPADTTDGTAEPGEPAHGGVPATASMWYRWTAVASGPVQFDTCSTYSAVDTVLAVYSGTALGALTRLGEADDTTGCGNGKGGKVTFPAVAGTEYRIAVDTKGARGSVTLTHPPGNDGFATALPLTLDAAVYGNSTLDGSEPGEPDHEGAGTTRTAWFRYTATASERLFVDACDSSFDTVVSVYTGATPAALARVTGNDDSAECATNRSAVAFDATAGTTYRIALAGRAGASGNYALALRRKPLNDDLAGASASLPSLYSSVTTRGATREPGEPAHAGVTSSGSLWYRWTALTDAPVSFDTCGSPFDTVLAVYTGDTMAELQPVKSSDDAPECATPKTSLVAFTPVAGQTYKLAVAGKGAVSGSVYIRQTQSPSNDAFESSGYLYNTVVGTTLAATRQASEPAHAGATNGRSVWYRWSAPSAGRYLIDTCGAGTASTNVAVYRGAVLASLQAVASNAGACGTGSLVTIDAGSAGEELRIAVDGRDGAEGRFTLSISQPPTNDAFAAQTATGSTPYAYNGQLRGASHEAGEPRHGTGTGTRSVWHHWRSTFDGEVTLTACADGDTVLAVYTGSALDALTAVQSAGAEGTCEDGQRRTAVTFEVDNNAVYHVAVDTDQALTYSLTTAIPPWNDTFSSPAYLQQSDRTTNTTVGASSEPGEPKHAGVDGGRSIWWTWSAPGTGGMIRIDTCGSTIDTLLAVYTGGGLATLQPVASNDDSPLCGDGSKASAVIFPAEPYGAYRIAVDGKARAAGAITLTVNPPANDAFAAAEPLTSAWVSSSSAAASREPGEPAHGAGPSVWYRWTAPASGRYRFDTCGSLYNDQLVTVYTGSTLPTLERVAGGVGAPACGSGTRADFTAVAGTTYRIAVSGRQSLGYPFTLQLRTSPANDSFANPDVLDPNMFFWSGSLAVASREDGEPEHGAGGTVWMRWTPNASGRVQLDTCDYKAGIAVYTGSTLAGLTPAPAGGAVDACPNAGSRVELTATAGTTYRIAVFSPGADDAGDTVSLRLTRPPTNDAFASAPSYNSGAFYLYGTTRATSKQAGEPTHAGNSGGRSAWYTWTAPTSGEAVISTCSDSTEFDTLIGVYTGSNVDSLTQVAFSDDAGSACANARHSRVTFQAVQGTAYRIAVDGKDGAQGSFLIYFESAPANDGFADASQLYGTRTNVSGTNVHAGAQAGEPAHAGFAATRSVWYRWTAPYDARVSLDTCSTGFDTLLAVYTGVAVDQLQSVQSADDGCPTGSGSRVVFQATAGTVYRIAVDGDLGATGSFYIQLAATPSNDDFASATDLRSATNPVSGELREATLETGEPQHAGAVGFGSIWYRWTSPVTGLVTLDTCQYGSSPDTLLAVYRGTTLTGLTPVGQSDDDPTCTTYGTTKSRVTFPATYGTEYRIAIAAKTDPGPVVLAFGLPPANDRFENAERVTEPAALVHGSTLRAAVESGEPAHAEQPAAGSVWYRWTAPSAATVRVGACAAGFATRFAVYTGAAVDALTPVASGTDAIGCDTRTRTSFAAEAGKEYWIAVDGPPASAGAFELSVNPPANDDRADAQPITTERAVVRGSNVAASAETGEPAHLGSGTARASVWFRWTAPATASYTFDTCGSDFDNVLAVYRAGTLAFVTRGTSGCGGSVRLTLSAQAGVEYLLAIDMRGGSWGDYVLHVNPPAFDRFDTAGTLTGSDVRESFDTNGAGKETGEPNHGNDPGGSSVWFTWRAPADRSGNVVVDTCDATFDTLLGVYTGTSVSSLTPIAGEDDSAGCGDGHQSRASFSAVANTTYRIAVDGHGGAVGSGTLRLVALAPPNDAFANAETLTGATPFVSASTAGATAQAGEPAHAGASAAASVWYRWTAPGSGRVTLDTCGSAFSTRLGVYAGTTLAGLSAVPTTADADRCASGRAALEFTAVAGTSYAIAVDGAGGDFGLFSLHVNRPRNDDEGTATPIPEEAVTLTGTLAGADPGKATRSVWYRWTAPKTGPVVVSTCGSGGGMAPTIMRDGIALPTSGSACGTASGADRSVTFQAVASTAYLIGVADGRTPPAAGPFRLNVNSPANDHFLDAAELIGSTATVTTTTLAASKEDGEPAHAGAAGGASIWFTWRASATGATTVRACAVTAPAVAAYVGDTVRTLSGRGSTIAAAGCPNAGAAVSISATEGTLYRIAVDGAGEPVTVTLTAPEDTTPPQTTLTDGPAEFSAATSAHFSFVANETGSTFECALDDFEFQACSSPADRSSLLEGEHAFRVRAVDPAGLRDATPIEHRFTVDLTAPDTTLGEHPPARHHETTATFGATASEPATFACSLDGGSYGACTFPLVLSNLESGPHTFRTRAYDRAGNVDPTPATFEFSVDVRTPQTTITSSPSGTVEEAVATFAFASDEEDSTFICAFDDYGERPCTSPLTLPALNDGEHTFQVWAVDAAGNRDSTPAERGWRIDTPPDTYVSGPTDPTADASPVFTFTSSQPNSRFTCAVDGAAAVPCASPYPLGSIADGRHTVVVTAIDAGEKPDPTPVSWAFTVDTTPPETSIVKGPGAWLLAPPAEFEFASSEDPAVFECRVDGETTWYGCSAETRLDDLEEGSHSVEVRALDRAGNRDLTPEKRAFGVDLTPPDTTLTGPPEIVYATFATVTATADEETSGFHCRLDEGAEAECTIPWVVDDLAAGAHSVSVAAVDRAGRVDPTPATRAFTVDPTAVEARAGDDRIVVAGTRVSFDGSTSRPTGGIDRYEWDFGDGGTATGATASHVFATAGEYEVTLKATGPAGASTDTLTVTVGPVQPGLEVTVTSAGAPLADADVLVVLPGGERVQAVSDAQGVAKLAGLPDGPTTVYAVAKEHQPGLTQALVAHGVGTAAIALTRGELGSASLDATRLNRQQILDAGIDPDDPANQNVYEFEVHLPFVGRSFSGYAGGGFGGSGGGGGWVASSEPGCAGDGCVITVPGGPQIQLNVRMVHGEPVFIWLIIPGKAKFLKEFWNVEMLVQNLSAAPFSFRGGHAELALPDGLSLAPTAAAQSRTIPLPDIPGGGQATASWTIRGDTEGTYGLRADYDATLDPFGQAVHLDARSAQPLKVWGGSALEMIVEAEDKTYSHYPYGVRIGLLNKADIPVYNPSVELLKQGKLNYIYQPREQLEQATDEIGPGETFWTDYRLLPNFSGSLVLDQAFVKKTAGNVTLSSTIKSVPPRQTPATAPNIEARAYRGKVVLDWDPIPGATSYEVYSTPDENTDFSDTPLPVRKPVPGADDTRVVVDDIPAEDGPFLAVSPIIDGKRDMRHPMIKATATNAPPSPTVDLVGDLPRCMESYDSQLRFDVNARDFAVKAYRWSINGGEQVTQSLTGTSSTERITIAVPGKLPWTGATVEVQAQDSEDEWGPKEKLSFGVCDYVAIGDSYSSGEGVPPFIEGTASDHTPSDDDNNMCHRSEGAYPWRVYEGLVDDHLMAEDHLEFHACSGAESPQFWGAHDKYPDEVAQEQWVDKDSGLVTISLGGNDVFFGKVLATCVVTNLISRVKDPFGLFDTPCVDAWSIPLAIAMPLVANEIESVYRRIKARAAYNARIVVVGYPPIFPTGWHLQCRGVSGADVDWLNRAQKEFNDMLERKAALAGVEFVRLDERFAGHDACASDNDAWFHNLVISDLFRDKEYSFHPNAAGQRAMAEAVSEHLSQHPAGELSTIQPNGTIQRTVNIVGDTLLGTFLAQWPGSDVEMTLRSPSGRVIDSSTTAADVQHTKDATSENFAVTNPEPGAWQVELYGADIAPGGEELRFHAQQFERLRQSPVALFDLDRREGVAPVTIAVDAERALDPDKQQLTYAWDFGDGTKATGARAQHVFAAAGTYTVTLTVTDTDGLSSTRSETVTVTAPSDPGGGGDGGGGGGGGGTDNGGGESGGGGTTVNPGGPPSGGGGPGGGGGGPAQPSAAMLGKLKLPASVKAKAFKRGLSGTLEILAARVKVRATLTLTVGKRKLGKQTITLGPLSKGRRTIKLKPSKALVRKLGKRRGAQLTVELTVPGTPGQRALKATIKVR